MINIILVDDDMDFLNLFSLKIQIVCNSFNFQYNLQIFNDSSRVITDSQINIAFLDVDMPNKTGFEIAYELKKKNNDCDIVYISAKDDLVYQSFDYTPVNYFIRKSLPSKQISSILNRLFLKYNRKKLEFDKYHTCYLDEIIYVEKFKNYLEVHTINGVFTCRFTIKDFLKEIESNSFARIYKSIVINMKYVNQVFDKYLLLNNIRLPISRKYKNNIKNLL